MIGKNSNLRCTLPVQYDGAGPSVCHTVLVAELSLTPQKIRSQPILRLAPLPLAPTPCSLTKPAPVQSPPTPRPAPTQKFETLRARTRFFGARFWCCAIGS